MRLAHLVLFALIVAHGVAAAAPLPPDAQAALRVFEGVWQVQPMRGPRGESGGPPPTLPSPPEGSPAARLAEKVPGLDRGDFAVYRVMTPAGRTAFEAMDPRELPTNNCRSGGVPTLAAVPTTQVWSLGDDVLSIRHDVFDTVRTVSLTAPAPEGGPTGLGRAIGAWNDGVLTITTSRFTAGPGALSRNAPGSAARVVTERYRLAEDGQSMVLEMTVEDPLFLTQPLVIGRRLRRAPAGHAIEAFPCDPEASRRHLGDASR